MFLNEDPVRLTFLNKPPDFLEELAVASESTEVVLADGKLLVGPNNASSYWSTTSIRVESLPNVEMTRISLVGDGGTSKEMFEESRGLGRIRGSVFTFFEIFSTIFLGKLEL